MTPFERPKGSGNWAAKFVLNGKQEWVPGSPFPSESSAVEAERRHRDYLLHRRTAETCASFADRWLIEWARPSESTRRNYARAIERFKEAFGPLRLDEIERLSARTWALGQPRYVHRTVRAMFEDARNVGLVEANPFTNLRLPAAERSRQIEAPTLEQYKTLIESTSCLGGYRDEFRAMIQFAAWTGVRAGELQALHWDDVAPNAISIRRSRKVDGSEGPPKNGKPRVIAFLPPARVLDSVPRRPDPYVFHSPRGKRLDKGSLFYAWRAVRATAGLGEVRWHDLRHFCATQLLEMGLSHFDVSVQLGHEDGGALVMERYGHPSKDAARARLVAAFELDETAFGSSATERDAAAGEGRA